MKNITKVGVSSRRSCKVGNEYLTFEMTLEANVENMNEEERKVQIAEMWDYAGEEVDKQIIDTVKAIQ